MEGILEEDRRWWLGTKGHQPGRKGTKSRRRRGCDRRGPALRERPQKLGYQVWVPSLISLAKLQLFVFEVDLP